MKPFNVMEHDFDKASTEPRFCERGNFNRPFPCDGSHCASTEPRFCERGNMEKHPNIKALIKLQRSRAFVSAEMPRRHAAPRHMGRASTEPRFCERGNSSSLG